MGPLGLNLALLVIGAGLGGMGRFTVLRLIAGGSGENVLGATLLVNVSGALAAGALVGHVGLDDLSASPLGVFLLAGVLGGYTTVSSLGLQTVTLWSEHRRWAAGSYLGATLLLGTALCALGWMLTGATP